MSPTHCLDEQTILGFCRGGLAPSLLAGIEEHLGECDECRTLVRALARASIPDASHDASQDVPPDVPPARADAPAAEAPPAPVPGSPPEMVPGPRPPDAPWRRAALGGLVGLVFVGLVIAALEMRASDAARPVSNPVVSSSPETRK